MVSPGHELYRSRLLKWLRHHGQDPGAAEALWRYAPVAMMMWHLDLEPARPILGRCYASSPHGGHPKDPIVMLRLMLVAVAAGLVGSPNGWVKDFNAAPVLRALAGLGNEKVPAASTFYGFMHRLQDGPHRRSCEHATRPSELEREEVLRPRSLGQQRKELEEQQARLKLAKARRRRDKRQHKDSEPAPLSGTAVADSKLTERLVAELRGRKYEQNPDDLLERLGSILFDVAVVESAHCGLLGDVRRLRLGGDGSPLRTAANGNGRRTCEHQRAEHCDCPRYYSDPGADWGWDHYRKQYFFGHHSYTYGVSCAGHDLPLSLYQGPASDTDYRGALYGLERLRKRIAQHGLPWKVWALIHDCGVDAEPFYEYLCSEQIRPVIPLRVDAPAVHPGRPKLRLSWRGVPLCKGGVEMACWGATGLRCTRFVCPVKAHRLGCCPLAPENDLSWRCQPQGRWTPTVAISVKDNPRLCPPIARNSTQYETLMKQRSGCERRNSLDKVRFDLEAAHHRRPSFWLIRRHLIAILEHALAWVSDIDSAGFVNELLGHQQPLADTG
jgi:hypothetical protein